MSRLFCPDYGALPTHHGYLPMHSLFLDEKLKLTTFKGGPRYFKTRSEARQAAKDYVAEHINGRDRAEQIESPVNDALADEAAAFLARRDQETAEERAKFGTISTVFLKGGKTVAVEHRTPKAKAMKMRAE